MCQGIEDEAFVALQSYDTLEATYARTIGAIPTGGLIWLHERIFVLALRGCRVTPSLTMVLEHSRAFRFRVPNSGNAVGSVGSHTWNAAFCLLVFSLVPPSNRRDVGLHGAKRIQWVSSKGSTVDELQKAKQRIRSQCCMLHGTSNP